MRANSIIMILLAGVFGVIAVVLANLWLADQRNAMAARGPEVPQDTIVVASVALKFGDTLSPDNLREIPWPSGAVPVGAFKTEEEALAGEGQRQVLTPINVNEPVLTSKITGPGQRATLSAVLTEGMKAVAIRVNDVLGVAGFVLPGDRVDILLTRSPQGEQTPFVDVLLQSVKVLAIDQVADESRDNPTVVKAVTLEVTTADAQKLTLAANIGQLSLALREVASDHGEQTNRVTLADLVGETPEQIAAKQAELQRQKALDEERAAERKRAQEQIAGIRDAVESVGKRLETRIDTVEDQLNQVKQPVVVPVSEPQVREVAKEIEAIKEVVVEPELPVRATVGVFRGLQHQEYDVPRLN